MFQTEDEEGQLGVRLAKDLVKTAGKGLKSNLSTLGARESRVCARTCVCARARHRTGVYPAWAR